MNYPLPESNVGYTIMFHRPYSDHPDDTHLISVLAYNPNKKEYVAWVYNGDAGGFCWGHYFRDGNEALKFYKNRKFGVVQTPEPKRTNSAEI